MEKNKFLKAVRAVTPEEIAVSLLSAFLVASTFVLAINSGKIDNINYIAEIKSGVYFSLLLSVWVGILALRVLINKGQPVYLAMLSASAVFGYLSVISYGNIYFSIGVLAILGYINYYLLKEDKLGFEAVIKGVKAYDVVYLSVGMGAVLFTLVFSWICICRYRSFNANCFDMGIFAQMYEYMAKTGMPLTTCERGYLLSHFYIHFSPIYYLFLPVYMLFRTPECLLVIQSAMVFGAVIPLLLLLKSKGFKPIIAIIICYIYLLSPAIAQPLLFDFHENKFIPFFMLWFIYFYETKKYKLMYPALLLTLMIKEDTAIYMIVLSLYFIISDKNRKHGIITLLCSLVYFVGVMIFIQSHGLGLMEEHYGLYYLEGERGVFSMVKNIFYAPGFFVGNVFSSENFEYIIYMLGSLLFVPLINKDLKGLVLLLPFVAFNLMTDYEYQHDIGHQYNYGSMVLMLYLFTMNIATFPRVFKNLVCITALLGVVILSANYRPDTYSYYPRLYMENAAEFKEIDRLLAELVDKNASVTAKKYILTHMAYHDKLYLHDDDKPEYYGENELILTDYYVMENATDYNIRAFLESDISDRYYKYYEDDKIIIFKLK